ncbi:RluA family pseudouridine synthase [Blautia schinkii]|nr:RluA family pseudouridine synthase [Blautia schinkii]
MDKEWKYLTGSEDEGKTVGEILRAAGFSKKEISRQKFLPGGILLDGEQCRVTCRVHEGQMVALMLREGKTGSPASPDRNGRKDGVSGTKTPDMYSREAVMSEAGIGKRRLPLQICYEDEDLIVVDKPAGLACHLGRGHYEDNLGSILQRICADDKSSRVNAVRLIGRLDKDTSGLVVLAKNRAAAARLWKQRSDGTFVKYYQAFVHGYMPVKRGTIKIPVMKIPGEKNKMQADEQGLPAVTHYRVLQEGQLFGQKASLLECVLDTGRTHQIRVHMAYEGHPLFGDPIYGVGDKAPRLCLHAQRICLRQPFTGDEMVVCTPEFSELL